MQRLEDAIHQARADESRLDEAFRAAAERVARLRAERVEAFRRLAELKLDALTRQTLVGEIDAVERRALDLIRDGRRAMEHLSERRREAERLVADAEGRRHERAEAVEAALKAIADLRARVEADARVSAEWVQQRDRLEAQAHTADEAERKAEQAERDRVEKGRPYEADPLFSYLWRKGFGTSADRSGPLVRYFDRKVARLVGYDKARANYALLTEIPVRLRDHAARMREEIAAERARLTAVERASLVEAGMEPLEARATEARMALDAAERDLAEVRQRLNVLDRESNASGGNMPYRETVELLARADSQQSLRRLMQEAQATATPEDDALVRRIEAAEAQIGGAEAEMNRIRREMHGIVERRAAIERERDEFQRRGYDNPWGTVSNEQVLANVLAGVLGGIVQGAVLRDVLHGGYHQGRSPWDGGFGGGFPFPTDSGSQGGGGPWGGGGGGGPWSGGGGRDDGFTTGGSI
ncbi:hypothetical protein [Salinarimonas soli]|uniref:hypothetical protein n=1 Tax=Salinarimonas soli TaxID=1638099 RepID=UPI0016620366|nr:hypothetical protein [Salinarimonas soli]